MRADAVHEAALAAGGEVGVEPGAEHVKADGFEAALGEGFGAIDGIVVGFGFFGFGFAL